MKKDKNKLTPKEQKTTAAFKLMSTRIEILEKSLKITQDELEVYRGKYHAVDKDNTFLAGKNQTLALHEILKFLSSGIIGAIGVNMLSSGNYIYGTVVLLGAVVLYSAIVWFDRK